MTNSTPTLTMVKTARSLFGSGTLINTTYRDDEGNEWYSIGGSAPVMTKTAADIAAVAAAVKAASAEREALA